MSPEVTCQCGHEWTTRKSLDEITQLRCSECGTTSDEDIEVDNGEEEKEPPEQGTDIIEEVEAKAYCEDLIGRICRLISRCERTAPPSSGEKIATELKPPLRRMEELLDTIDSDDRQPSVDELSEVEEYVDDLETAIDDHADELERRFDLQTAISELETDLEDLRGQKGRLNDEIEELKENKARLNSERKKLRDQVGELQKISEHREEAYEMAKAEYRVMVPCSYCDEYIEIIPGTETYEAAVDCLLDGGWAHQRCINQPPPRA